MVAATVEAAVPEVGIAWDVGAAVEAAATTHAMPTVGETSNQGVWNFGTVSHKFVPPDRPTNSMLGLHTGASNFSQNFHAQLPPLYTPGVSVPLPTPQQSLTNNSLAALRQQMEESNVEAKSLINFKDNKPL